MPQQFDSEVQGETCVIDEQTYYKIDNTGRMPPFLLAVMSHCDLWMYASSNGALTAGRKSPEGAIFPYDTVDRINAAAGCVGPFTVIRVNTPDGMRVWQPFSAAYSEDYTVRRSIAKNRLGTRLRFQEINCTLELKFVYEWAASQAFGWVRKAFVENLSQCALDLQILDGLINVMPSDVPLIVQQTKSYLADAYRKTELHNDHLGIFTLGSGIVDRAEASEVLKCNIVWQCGREIEAHLLSTKQLTRFMQTGEVESEANTRGVKGAYLTVASHYLQPQAASTPWHTVADADLDQVRVSALCQQVNQPNIQDVIETAIADGETELKRLLDSSDAAQVLGDEVYAMHHVSNVLFNCARGGVLVNNYSFEKQDFCDFLRSRNQLLAKKLHAQLEELDEELDFATLDQWRSQINDPDLDRLAMEYVPLSFARRHGDPSRPWNRFDIQTHRPDGGYSYQFQGNWRDIFQNWEALGRSFPECYERFITIFLNASTVDGYNPYRITRNGIDWEILDPDDPWSSIGYWGDHQIVYLLRLLEALEAFRPGLLATRLNDRTYCYADVPYRLRSYQEICDNPYNSVVFDIDADVRARDRATRIGGDGKLLFQDDQLCRVTLAEKLLVPILSKLSNLVPSGGVWMNTARPEWNDANNALAGNGLSVVTACYLYRHLIHLKGLFVESDVTEVSVHKDVIEWWDRVFEALQVYLDNHGSFEQASRQYLDAVGTAFSEYRQQVYVHGFADPAPLSVSGLTDFLTCAASVVAETIEVNQRPDGLYQAYNLLKLDQEKTALYVDHLYEMLEGQVAVMDSGLLDEKEIKALLEKLYESPLYCEEQKSFLLYPDRELPGFLEKNRIPETIIQGITLFQRSLENNDTRLIAKDAESTLRFNPDMRNAEALQKRLDLLAADGLYEDLPVSEAPLVHEVYEQVFEHDKFTGRSGTMFSFEGLGCIYWHLVAKLLLSTSNAVFDASMTHKADLKAWYYRLREGFGFNKTPLEWGAWPLDPYSHKPNGRGAQQPGMTGQVKEEIIARFGELGVCVKNACIEFQFDLLRQSEFRSEKGCLQFFNVSHEFVSLEINPQSLGFTFCQVPFIYTLADQNTVRVELYNGEKVTNNQLAVDAHLSRSIFERRGEVKQVVVEINRSLID